jgi:hypothetical protein
MYYVNDMACATLEDAEEVAMLYKVAGVAATILTETEYFKQLHWANMPPYNYNAHDTECWQDPV